MRPITRYLLMLAMAATLLLTASSCMRESYMMFEDGDFDGLEFSDYDQIHNAELDLDDLDR